MSLNNEGCSCVRCHAYLFPEDDVVYCPICGAPHHRDCYEALGHCALEELHGTEREYSAEKEKEAREEAAKKEKVNKESAESDFTVCRMCSETYNKNIRHCPKCGTPNLNNFDGFPQFDLLGGVPADLDLGEGVTAEEAKKFVVSNPHRYIPKFALLNKNKKTSWNWLAFLFPCEWLLSRKMYKGGIFAGLFSIVSTLLTYPLLLALNNHGFYDTTNRNEMIKLLYDILPEISILLIVAAFAGFIIDITVRVLFGIFGDYMYKNYTISSIKKIRNESQDMDYDYRKMGGVNILLFLLGLFITQYLPQIISTFL